MQVLAIPPTVANADGCSARAGCSEQDSTHVLLETHHRRTHADGDPAEAVRDPAGARPRAEEDVESYRVLSPTATRGDSKSGKDRWQRYPPPP